MKHFLFMAISKGKESTENNTFKRYEGVASCFVKAVNPNKAEMEALYGNTLEKAPEYTDTTEDRETGKPIPTARITFVIQPDPEKYGEVGFMSHTYFLRKEYRFNRDKSKVQVIDKYGRTGWVTIEQAKKHEIPMYSNGPANLDRDYRPAYVGEEDLTQFLISYLNIPSPMKFNNTERRWYPSDNLNESECRLDNIESYFKNDFSELKDAIALQPNNKVKILFGVRTAEDGKQFQVTYGRKVLRNNVNDYSKLDEEITKLKENSTSASIAATDYVVGDFQEYKVEPTVFSDSQSDDPQELQSSDLPFDMTF